MVVFSWLHLSLVLLAVAVGWLVPAIFVIVAAVIDRVDIPEIPDEYKPGSVPFVIISCKNAR